MISITPFRPRRSQLYRRLAPLCRPYVSLVASLLSIVPMIVLSGILGAIANESPKTTEELIITESIVPTETIVLGRLPQHHYVVIIPVSTLMPTPQELVLTTPQFLLLQKIRTIVPQAFISRHALGHYIYVGGFDRLGLAQQQLRQIRPTIPSARVVYFP